MSPKLTVPSRKERRDFFEEKTYGDLQKYRFYDASGKNLRFVDINNDVREGFESINAILYIFEDEDIDKKLVEYTDRLVEYTDTDTLYYKKPSLRHTISSTIRRSIIRPLTAKKSPRKGGKNRRTSNNKQKTRKTRKQ